jgi:2,4-dienoyl-CoA reductase-like NADH-dependent reductase (Old Yellow Enzyme family)
LSNSTHANEGKYNYKNLAELENDILGMQLDIKISNNLCLYKQEVKIGNHVIPNSLATLPMEGGDSDEMGSPTDMTLRKYIKMAKGGAGLIWLEAVSVTKDGRSNDKQLWITEDNWKDFKTLNDMIKKSAKEEFGPNYNPMTIIQLNHAGRYCKVNGKKNPIIATHKKSLDDRLGIDENYPVVTDEYLDNLKEAFLTAVRLCKKAGFDGIDIKACHGYLISELLSAYEREGKYGGSFENRTRLMLDIIDAIQEDTACEGLVVSSRLNIYDGLPYPQGWGVSDGNGLEVDLTEPKKLVKQLSDRGVQLISLSMGNPYAFPHINKPFDLGGYVPPENAIWSCNRLIRGVGKMQKNFPDISFVGLGYTWFRNLAPYVGAGSLEHGLCKIVGFGREAISYPDFARDILDNQEMKPTSVCVSCSKCSELKSKIGTCGCVIRDAEVYLPIYKQMKASEVK